MSKTSNILLRVALAFAFLYPAYGFWKNPLSWVGYIPSFVKDFGLSQDTLLIGLAVVHVIIALWILSGLRIAIPSVVAALFLGSVVYFNWNQIDILFRDISLALAALALAFSNRR
ncbi:MAG TPA: hypothetical protein DEF00_03565 [Candidatus Taylorbacteria bacterium]|nr:MAG: hypothetical protein UY03_C0034G0005 [Parcubacteria group bacterium GW2011_GWA2_47_64]KKU96903.1 MAG: hypothetical protein UY29_C0005G0036 [Parcubacteria group bacterium GW2011_GWC2_48_17]HBV01441.1 hypothetical protein [Candidatus Taylorbacteria bacterium]